MQHARQQGASERHACQLVHQLRGTQRYQPTLRNDEDALTRAIIALATQYGRYGYRRIAIKLQEAGWNVGKDRVERIWRREGLKVPQKQKPRSRLWLNDGSCVRLRPERPNHVWSYDFMSAFTHDGRTVRFLNRIDEYTRECLAIHVGRRINSKQVIDVLAEAMIEHGIPGYIRSDNGPEFVAKELRKWLAQTGAKTLYIEPGSPWENGYCESFNSKMRDEFLNGEIFYSLKEVRVLAERWRVYFNTERPHSSLGYKPPAPAAWQATSVSMSARDCHAWNLVAIGSARLLPRSAPAIYSANISQESPKSGACFVHVAFGIPCISVQCFAIYHCVLNLCK